MPWLLASPGQQHPWYWLGMFFSYMGKDFNHLCHVNVEEWHKMKIYVLVPPEKFTLNFEHVKGSRQELASSAMLLARCWRPVVVGDGARDDGFTLVTEVRLAQPTADVVVTPFLHTTLTATWTADDGRIPSLLYGIHDTALTLREERWYPSQQRSSNRRPLSHLSQAKMAAISQTVFSDAFLWMKSVVFLLKFHWSLFLRVKLTISQHWFR